jgi:acyl-CoA synthetase (AMP-forming)/AMP-acid ligase II
MKMNTKPNSTETCNIASALVRQAELQGQNTAIHYPASKRGKRIRYEAVSYATLNELSDQYAHGLVEYGIGRGTRSALMLTPGLDFIAMFFALFKAGALPVLIDPGIGIKPLKACLADARPEAFIGVTKAQLARGLLGWARGVKLVTAGPKLGWGGLNTEQLRKLGQKSSGGMLADTQAEEMAALLFTSGSTGIPKGVVYRHRHFTAQVEMLKSAFDIQPGEVDLATFPPFALFDPALGMTTVVPVMDPTRPAKADPRMLTKTIEHFGVTNIFGSPALLNVLGRYTESENISMPGVRRIISAGAAMPIATILRLQKSLSNHAEVYTPYGATECLPVSSVSGTELNAKVERLTAIGEGTCVGRPVEPNNVKIIGITDNAVESFEDSVEMPVGIIGEIVVNGPTSTDTYWQQTEQTQLAKITDSEGKIWHRMGDVGYFDTGGRLWYCGRKSQRVDTGLESIYPDQVEAIFNVHPEVARTALVGIGNPGQQTPVLCVEPLFKPNARRKDRIEHDLLQIGQRRAVSRPIQKVLFHKSFPVDIRHNAKIGREKLAVWAEKKLA